MRKEKLDVPAADGVSDSYLVVPDGGPHPGVLLFPDGFGPRARLDEMAERIAEAGYAVLVPNLLYRSRRAPLVDMSELADPEKREVLFASLGPMVAALDADAITRDAAAYLDFLAAQPGVSDGPVVITGYCLGSTNALRVISALPERVKAIAGFHGGRMVTDAPDSPHLAVGSITGEVYLGHADQDQSMTAEQIKTLEAAFDAAGVTYRSEIYEGASHGYTMTDTAMYHEAAEKRHWENLFALLERVHGR